MAIQQSVQGVVEATEDPTLQAGELVKRIRSGRPVRIDGAVIEGDVDLDGVEYPHRLILTNCVFLGHLHLTEARFAHTVDLSGCELRESLNLFATRVDGQLKLKRARICRGTRPPIHHNFDQIEVRGRLNGTHLRSEVPLSFRQASLGEIGFDGLEVDGDLDLQIAKIQGDLFCQVADSGRPVIRGSVQMTGLTVGGHADFSGIRIEGDLVMANAEVRGDLLCQEARGFRPEILGTASFFGAKVGGQLVLDGRLFEPAGTAAPPVDVRQNHRERRRHFLHRMLTGRQEPDGDARLNLDRARLSKLAVRERIPESLSADGLTFDDLELPHVPGDCEYSELLRRTRPFKRSTYLAVEDWLNNKGLDEAAGRVYLEMSDRDLITGKSSLLVRWLKWLFLGVAIGYGARPRRLMALFLIAFALSCWVFSQPGSLVSYSEKPAAAPDPWPPEAQTAWVTLGVALRCHFPMLLFWGEPNYVPSPHVIPRLGIRYDAYALLISAISWVLVPLFLAGLTGIVRQRR
ncbi:MAG: hypothetical protein QOF89_3448 [Acidobacteriota bacterium]|jgi:hypothetical protein|nr:hypothetical protein [Acidobacteriota bacterium]